jgi:outer membrane protein assembly factor BamB
MRKSIRCLSLAALALAATTVLAADWAQFHGPAGSAVSPETNLPTEWDKTTGLRWKAELPGKGLSNPIITGGHVYVTACSGYRENRLHVLCFDERSGKKLWERRFASTGNTGCHPTTNMAAPTPATDGKVVYAQFATADLAALDADGNLLWYRSLAQDYPGIANQVGIAASPILVGDTLIVSMETDGDSFILGVDKATGKNRWRIERPRGLNWASPIMINSKGMASVVLVSPNAVDAIDPATGKTRWTLPVEGGSNIPSAVAGDGILFLPGKETLAIRPSSADDKTPEILWKSEKLRTSYASPVYYQGKLYFLTDPAVICVDALTGKEVWRERVKGPFWTTPVAADGKLYMTNEKGLTQVLKLGDKPSMVAKNPLPEKEMVQASPAIANGAIFIRSDSTLYCIGAKK